MDTKKLRQKILDLAIRGKLVPQDPNDEPASVLLERIRTEKERLIKEGKIKRSKKSASSDTPHYENRQNGEANEVPFELPEGWELVKLSDIAVSELGKTLDKGKNSGTPRNYLCAFNVKWCSFDLSVIKKILLEDVELERYRVRKGDLLICEGGDVGRAAIWESDQDIYYQNALHRVRFKEEINQYFYLYVLQYYKSLGMIDDVSGGVTIKHFTQNSMKKLSFPLPPIAEQKRIVSAIKQWFALIDTLETAKEDLQTSIAQTKSKILDLAIHGKLVPQDPNDEPAIELLKRINPKFTPCDNAHYENMPFDIPESWVWTCMAEVNEYKSASVDPSKYPDNDFELYSVPAYETGMPEFVKGKYISSSKKSVSRNDVLLCKINPHLNRAWIVSHHKEDLPCLASSEWIIFRNSTILPQYLSYCFTSLYFKELMLSNVSGVGGSLMRAQPSIVSKYLFPLPPVNEQRKIVEAIQQYYNVLDNISANL